MWRAVVCSLAFAATVLGVTVVAALGLRLAGQPGAAYLQLGLGGGLLLTIVALRRRA